MPDEFGGIEVGGGQDEFGGVAVAEAPQRTARMPAVIGSQPQEPPSPEQLAEQGLTPADYNRAIAEAQGATPKEPARGFFGGMGQGFGHAFEATAKGPGVFTLSNELLGQELRRKEEEMTGREAPGAAGKTGEFIGGLGGTLAQAIPIGIIAKKPGISAMFASAGAYDAFIRAGTRALAEGKSLDEAVDIGKKTAVVGGLAQAAVAAALPGGAPASLGEALVSGIRPGAAAAGAVGAENITQRALGLKTPVSEGMLPAALTMGLLPAGGKLASMAYAKVFVPRSIQALEETPTQEIPYRVPSSLEVTETQPAGAATVIVNPEGKALAGFEQLSPREQLRALRNRVGIYQAREERVRPAEAPVPIIGASRAAELAQQQPEIVEPPPEIVAANQAATAPSMTEAGGEVSFGAPAAAKAIPSARQTAQEQPLTAQPTALEASAAAEPTKPPPLPEQAPPAPTGAAVGPSSQALGITPPGGRLLGKIIEAFTPKAQEALPRTASRSAEALPDLGNRAENTTIANEPTGIGRIPGLGWLFDPRQRATTDPEKSLINYFYEQAVGQAHVKALGSTFGTKFKELFPRNETGEFTTVASTKAGQSLQPSDVFEELQRNPNAYRLTPAQRQGFDELMRYENRARELERQYNLHEDPNTEQFEPGKKEEGAYYTRGRVIGQPLRPGGMGGVVTGARQFFQKARAFESEQQGVSRGFNYPMNVDDRILLRLSRLYKAIGDRRLAEDPGLGGRWGSDSGPLTYQEGQVFQPAFRSGGEYKIFPVEVANKINTTLAAQQTAWLKSLQSGSDVVRSLSLGFDLGWGFIQGLPTAFKNPKAWADAQVVAFKAFTNPDAFAAYIRNNVQATRELAEFGSPVGNLPEMVAGMKQGGVLSKIPGAIQFSRSMQTFLDVARIEKWKALREITPREEWPTVIQGIEHELGMGRMESIGVGPAQSLAERLFLLAPSYYRGGIGMIGDMFAKGVTGAQARRGMMAYMAGTTATFMAGAMAVGMPWEEIKRRLNPASGNFLMVPVNIGGKSVEVGFGGILRSLMRLGGSIIKTSIEHPENWGTLASDRNPIIKWLRGHSSPVAHTVWDQFSGKDYLGEDTDLRSMARGSLPLSLQALLKRDAGETGEQTVIDSAFSFLGMNAWPQSTRNAMIVERNRIASQKYGAPYEDLRIHQQAMVQHALEKDPTFTKTPPTPQQIERAFRLQIERQAAVQAGLDEPIRKVLAEKEIRVPGFRPVIKVGPSEIILTEAQQDRYKALIIEEYNRTLKNKVNILRRRSPLQAQDLLNEWAGDASERARMKLQREFNR